ncbi:MAG TPA: hypothetical protein VF625_13825 [Longimicrobium sp.]
METLVVLIFLLSGGSMVLLMGAGFHNEYRLLRRLRKKHTPVWHSLGSPTLFMNNSIRGNLNVRAYIREKRYLDVADGKLHRVARRKVVLEYGYVVCFVVAGTALLLVMSW